MTQENITLEQVLQFLNNKDVMYDLADFIDKKLRTMDLPKDVSAYDDDDNDELCDEVQNYGITFFCDFGDSDSRDDAWVMGYNPDTRELVIKGGMVLDGLTPVSLDELEYNSLLELARCLA